MNKPEPISLDVYQKEAHETAFFEVKPLDRIIYLGLAIAGEAGELFEAMCIANIEMTETTFTNFFQSVHPFEDIEDTAISVSMKLQRLSMERVSMRVAKECGDVLWYISELCTDSDVDLSIVVRMDVIDHLVYIMRAMSLPELASTSMRSACQFAETIKKAYRDRMPEGASLSECPKWLQIDPVLLAGIKYLVNHVGCCAARFGWSMEEVAALNLRKLKDRQARDVLSGSGDER